ncbi:hypothetical protein MKZ38_002423 [Zalerion maritima]|uniref:RRM domain-containing protein n=1 Tax=Zalerion maritima TaxID=339359 RepID=A0AAD5RQF3_9PEZI|nr:hypothetical protein MKZ38_002423 [Zalerion maritima]
MSYPRPPGVSSTSSGSSHPSLPARPPPPKPSRFKPAFTSAAPARTPSAAPPPGFSSPYTTSQPPATGAPQYGASYTPPYGAMPPAMNAPGAYGAQAYPPSSYGPPRPAQQQPPYYGAQGTPPTIRNPFPAPSQQEKNADYDPEMAAQIAQWQSAYAAAETNAVEGRNGKPGASGPGAAAAAAPAAGPVVYSTPDPNTAAPVDPNEKKKTAVREGGGKKWNDDTLIEWDPSHFRLFVGNLAGETTDESLLKAFARWSSVSKARVIRDKRTTKSKGFGFVSFSDADDFFQAAKEMNGKYIQSHPVIVKRSTTEIKTTNAKNNKGHNNKYKNKNKSRDANYEPHLGPHQGGGIQKPGQKTKGGLKLLG